MEKKKRSVYNPEIELAKGATLEAASYDKTQKIKVTVPKVTVGGIPGSAEISGIATGHIPEAGQEGTCDLWLSIFRYMRPDGTTDHVGKTPLEPPYNRALQSPFFQPPTPPLKRSIRPFQAKNVVSGPILL